MAVIWSIDGLGTESQTLTVVDEDGPVLHEETRDGWTWSGDRPAVVDDVAPDGSEIERA